MFSQLLLKSFQIGEKLFHVLANPTINVDDWEKLGLEIIKDAALIKKQIEENTPKAEPETSVTDEVKESEPLQAQAE